LVKTPLCPWNWALLVFSLQLIGMPLLITLDGPALGVLPYLPSSFAINLAIVLNCAAFITTCCIYNHFSRFRIARAGWLDRLRDAPDAPNNGSARWIGIYALLGIAGLLLSFGNIAGILNYFNNPSYYRDYFLEVSSNWQGLAAILLKPFLGFAVIMGWCGWLDSRGMKSWWWLRVLLTMIVLGAVVLSFSLFSYNRGMFAVPLVAVAAVTLVKGDKLSWRMIAVAGALIFALMPVYALYRGGAELGEDLLARTDLREMLVQRVNIGDIVETYGDAPQFFGFLLETSHWGRDPHWGVVTVSSILSPVPVLGKPFRRNSGFGIFNRMIYGTETIGDQNAPLQGEAFLDFHIPGILFVSAMLGWVLHHLQRAFERSRSSLEIYVWQYLSIWIGFVILGSVGVLSQILIYYCWPIYPFLWLMKKPRLAIRLRMGIAQGA